MKKHDIKALKDVVSRFSRAKVLVIGDVILDEYIWGKVSRISPEAPVPVVWVDQENFMPGGASNVAGNIAALGGKAVITGIVGNDARGDTLRNELKSRGVDVSGLIVDGSRPTILKTRVIANHQQVVRIDKEKTEPLSSRVAAKIIDYVKRKIDTVDSLLIEDYGKGVITPHILNEIVLMAKKKGKIITVDPKETHFSFYRGITAITPNQEEASYAVGHRIHDIESLRKAGARLLKKLSCDVVLITLGERGMYLFQRKKKPIHISTIARDVFDVSGAGDTVISAFTLALGCKANPVEATHIANCAAGIVVGKLGTAVATKEELIKELKEIR